MQLLAPNQEIQRRDHRLPRSAGSREVAQGGAWVSGVEFEYTHDLHRLIAEVMTAVGEFPFDVAEVVALTEHAVPLRYDEILDTEPLDRDATSLATPAVRCRGN